MQSRFGFTSIMDSLAWRSMMWSFTRSGQDTSSSRPAITRMVKRLSSSIPADTPLRIEAMRLRHLREFFHFQSKGRDATDRDLRRDKEVRCRDTRLAGFGPTSFFCSQRPREFCRSVAAGRQFLCVRALELTQRGFILVLSLRPLRSMRFCISIFTAENAESTLRCDGQWHGRSLVPQFMWRSRTTRDRSSRSQPNRNFYASCHIPRIAPLARYLEWQRVN